MKIVAQSIVVPSTPYVHLGYGAAAYSPRPYDAKIGGAAAFTLGVGMLLLVGICISMPGWAPLNFVRRRGRFLLYGAALFIALGLGLISWNQKFPTYSDPYARTHEQGYRLLHDVAELREQGKPVSFANGDMFYVKSVRSGLDGWNFGMRAVTEDVEGSEVFCVASAGPDHMFNTEDDIRMSLGPEGELKVTVGHGKPNIM